MTISANDRMKYVSFFDYVIFIMIFVIWFRFFFFFLNEQEVRIIYFLT